MKESFSIFFAAIECLKAVHEVAKEKGDMCYEMSKEESQNPSARNFLSGKAIAYYDMVDAINDLIVTLKGNQNHA